ncbi:MAG TPA: hypothetical protein VE083_01520 [Terriglobales bacterium]|nr:hypothetical protein [Terriglobales bacterium]
MKAFLIAVITSVLCVGVAIAQEPAAQASGSASQSTAGSVDKQGAQVNSQTSGQGAAHATSSTGSAGAQVAQGTTIHAVLAKPVDSRKSKVGDEVMAKSTRDVKSNGQVVVPKGTRLLGHITEAKAKANGESDSALGIAFDRAILKDGRELPLALSIQALAATQPTASAAMESDSMMGSPSMSTGGHASGGVLGGATAPVGGVAGTGTNTLGAAGAAAGGTVHGATEGMTAGGTLTSSARGVVGLPGMSLNTDASNSTQGSVITSKSQNVHLESGTQMVLRVNAQ